jgi:hypothetical protein
LLASATFTFARAVTYEIMNLYAVKMAAVFMISTSTLAIRCRRAAMWHWHKASANHPRCI